MDIMSNSTFITINIRPLRSGWTLECVEFLEPQVFGAGGAAERSAVRLAAALTTLGWWARVVVHDLGGVATASLDMTPDAGGDARRRPTLH